jgi:hypothetical protein
MPFTGIVEEDVIPIPEPLYQVPTLTLYRDTDVLHLPFTATPGHIWCIGPGIEGLDQPESSVFQQRSAGQFGSYFRGVDVPAREIFLPLMVRMPTYQTMLNERDAYNALTSPYNDEPVRLVFTRPDGQQRHIDGYRAGNAPTWDRGTWVPRISWQKFGQTFICPFPWWSGPVLTATWTGPESVPFFPITPVFLSSSSVLGVPQTINVPGDVPAYPFWQICGPAESVTATHVETGRSWTFNLTLAGGYDPECATIDTHPRSHSHSGSAVKGPDGLSAFSSLEPPFDLWPIPSGQQTVQLDVTGADAGTIITMTIVSLWETA